MFKRDINRVQKEGEREVTKEALFYSGSACLRHGRWRALRQERLTTTTTEVGRDGGGAPTMGRRSPCPCGTTQTKT